MLPARLPKKPKRDSRWRSQAHLAFVRSHHCCIEGCHDMPIVVAHVRIGSGAGLGQKPDDFRTVSLCDAHHRRQHEVGERTFWADIDVEALIDAFCKASPRALGRDPARDGGGAMSDLVERLRAAYPHQTDPISLQPKLRNPDGPDAAAEIERLRAALADAENAHETYCKSWDMRKQMDRMKGALERIANEPHTPHEMKFIARAALENRHG